MPFFPQRGPAPDLTEKVNPGSNQSIKKIVDGWQALALSSRLHLSAALPHRCAAARPSTTEAIVS